MTTDNPFLRLVPPGGADDGLAGGERLSTRVGLTELDEVALTSGAVDVPQEYFVPDTVALATALVGPDAEGCRLRTLARSLAIELARYRLLQARQGAHIEASSFDHAAKIDRLMSGSTKRIATLTRLHREEIMGMGPKSVFMISAERVDITAGDS